MEIILKDIYKNIKTIAVFGSSPKEDRPSYTVSKELMKRGYQIIPINPNYQEILGKKVYKTIEEIDFEVDLALFFVNSDKVLELVKNAVDIDIKYIWLQENVISDEAKKICEENNVGFMMDRCIYKELKKIEQES